MAVLSRVGAQADDRRASSIPPLAGRASTCLASSRPRSLPTVNSVWNRARQHDTGVAQRERAGEALGHAGIEEREGEDEGTEAAAVRERVVREVYKLGVHGAEVCEGRKLCERRPLLYEGLGGRDGEPEVVEAEARDGPQELEVPFPGVEAIVRDVDGPEMADVRLEELRGLEAEGAINCVKFSRAPDVHHQGNPPLVISPQPHSYSPATCRNLVPAPVTRENCNSMEVHWTVSYSGRTPAKFAATEFMGRSLRIGHHESDYKKTDAHDEAEILNALYGHRFYKEAHPRRRVAIYGLGCTAHIEVSV
ncbi:hypothetical protein B0H17DRAFT_1138349 [Mycena rosella]|uniref:Uncharacterized protein n=1 Tax=Mycena rosella TaxID=1033263 RepID=A0AAD7GDP6_MYCRO|nr:hypothetical protein B0H17DRAFT_1138349 [Mycena rosella]